MDENIIVICVVMGLLPTSPPSVFVLITSYIAYARTKKWDKERTLKAANIKSETNTLFDTDEDDFLDTDDEAEYNERMAEEEKDKFLTFNQMWRKEFRKVWNGKGTKQLVKERGREERWKPAKAVAREPDRRERRRARKAGEGDKIDILSFVTYTCLLFRTKPKIPTALFYQTETAYFPSECIAPIPANAPCQLITYSKQLEICVTYLVLSVSQLQNIC